MKRILQCRVFYQFAAGYLCLRPVSEKKVENESSPGVLSEGITPKSRVLAAILLLEGKRKKCFLSIEAPIKELGLIKSLNLFLSLSKFLDVVQAPPSGAMPCSRQ